MVRYEVRRGTGYQPYYCRAVVAENGRVLMTSLTYPTRDEALEVAELLRNSAGAEIVDLT